MSKKYDIYIRTIFVNYILDDVTSLANSQISISYKMSSKYGCRRSLHTNVLTNVTIMPFWPQSLSIVDPNPRNGCENSRESSESPYMLSYMCSNNQL